MTRTCGFIMLFLSICLLVGGCFLISDDPVVTMSIEPSSGYAPLLVHLEAHTLDAQPLTYVWELGKGITVDGREVDHTFSGVGEIPIRLFVTDAQGRQTVMTSTVHLLNRVPHAQFTVQPNPAPTHYPIRFDARDSYDSDGTIESYHWDFGDGSTASGARTEHEFELPSTSYRITLTITDDAGDSNSTYRDIKLIGCDH